MFNKKEFHQLEDKSILKISGEDKFSFIQGIISNDVEILKKKSSIYSSMLSPQGKFIVDFFLSSYKDFLLLEVNEEQKNEIFRKLEIYKLRSNVFIEEEKNAKIFLISNDAEENIKELKNNYFCFDDPRFKSLFKRIYVFEDFNKDSLDEYNLKKISQTEYNDLRLKYSIPNFKYDVIENKSLLLEMRFDELNGISWTKGCYMGQEITARMKYRNLVKKKLFKIKINFISQINEEIKYNKEVVGYITSHNKKEGLAYINLKSINEFFKENLISGDSIIRLEKIWWSCDQIIKN